MTSLDPIVLALTEFDRSIDIAPHMQSVLRCVQAGRQAIVVVGATVRDEQKALAQSNMLPLHTEQSVHAWVRTEPSRAAAGALADALGATGLRARVADAGEIGPAVTGPTLDATPRSINARAVFEAFRDADVLIVAGGSGRSEDGRPAIVGDGSALLTAAFIAERLALELWAVAPEPATVPGGPDPAWTEVGSVVLPPITRPRIERRAALFVQRHGVRLRFIRDDLSWAGDFEPVRGIEPVGQEQPQRSAPRRIEHRLTRAG
ncbi:MAG: hypothetical protein DYG94_08740 [Leptolyngbya sp. PLA3]|nr:MAG: hypothetical protein EDM82_03055 [Cyanobacteria bacterium CYA]MCE7968817.1 hypothetical protein [Leptolyngbya sp. PL-A3]